MTTTNEKVLAALKTAMEAEMTGHHFYTNAAATTTDPQGKETFKRLAEEELLHFNYLKNQYASLLETGSFNFSNPLAAVPEADISGPIFSPQLKARIKHSHFEISALSVGMQLELNAVNFYRQCAESADGPEVKAFFNHLVQWEQGHYNGFAQELDNLKEEYWQANNFVPM
ncbi:MAG: ferritin family protein [Deltaproteobacteria bacterium]|nr:ferritin family protein [Deltaproteobacteria bacterium]